MIVWFVCYDVPYISSNLDGFIRMDIFL